MIELCAAAWPDGRVSMTISGGEQNEKLVYDTADLRLICRTDLLGHSNSAAVLAMLYRQRGDAFVNDLRGSFAIILYDHKRRALKAWTDHFGAEKLVFTRRADMVVIATDLRLLLPVMAERPEIDPLAVQEYLQYTCIPAPRTIFKGISRLKPGHMLTAAESLSVKPYWDIRYPEAEGKRPEAEWVAETRAAIRAAVERSRDSVYAERIGCFLSGGTDSSSVTGLVSKGGKHSTHTFSIGFDDPRYNEIHYARLAARHNRTAHHEYFVKPNDIVQLIENAVTAYDEPFGNSSIVPTYYCARLAREHGVTHLLAGDGGDELFGGNARYVQDRPFQQYAAIPKWLRRFCIEPAVAAGASCTNLRFFDRAMRYIRRSTIGVPDRFFSYSLLSSEPNSELLTGDFIAALGGHDPLSVARNHFSSAEARSVLNRWLYLDLKITISDNDLRKVHVMSRLAGVTARYPLLDPSLAEFTGTIPGDLKIRGSQLRYLFKKAMADILPPEIVTKNKQGFGLPYSVWVGEYGPLRDFTFDVLGSGRCRERGYVRKDLLEWLWKRYESVHQRFYGELLWVFMMLELWHLKQYDRNLTTNPEAMPVMQQVC